MAQNMMIVMAKALVKGRFNPTALTGLERFMLAQLTIPDRVPTLLAATNVEPYLIDKAYNYKLLAKSVEANLELFAKVKERFPAFDVIMVPTWLGLMLTGVAELGVQFEIEEGRVPYASAHPIKGIEDVKRTKPFTEPSGYFKMTLDINREAQRRFPDTIITFSNDGPWDLAMLMRGDKQLPMDFRIYKDYVETDDPQRKEKIRKHGDPDLWPAGVTAGGGGGGARGGRLGGAGGGGVGAGAGSGGGHRSAGWWSWRPAGGCPTSPTARCSCGAPAPGWPSRLRSPTRTCTRSRAPACRRPGGVRQTST